MSDVRPSETKPAEEAPSENVGPRSSPWRNIWVQRLGLCVIILLVVLGYMVFFQRGLAPRVFWFLHPSPGSFESIRIDDEPAHRLAESMHLPDPPDLTELDEATARNFYVALANVRNFPGKAEHYGVLGRVFEANGYREEALALYRKAIEKDEDDYRWHYHLGLAAAALGETDLARAGFDRTLELNADYAPAYLRLGDMHLAAGALDEAERMYQSYRQARPEDPVGCLALARLARQNGNWAQVVAHVEDAHQLGRRGKLGHQLLAQAYQELGDTASAQMHFKQVDGAYETDRVDDPLEQQVLGLRTALDSTGHRLAQLMEAGRYQEAAVLARRLIDQTQGQPDEVMGWVNLVECYRQLGESTLALDAVAQGLQVAPHSAELHTQHGLVRLEFGQLLLAAREADLALQHRPGYVPAQFLRGQALLRLASLDPEQLRPGGITDPPEQLLRAALEDLSQVVQMQPNNVAALMQRGIAHAMLKEYASAVADFEKAQGLHPELAQLDALIDAARREDHAAFRPKTQPADPESSTPSS